MPSETSVETVAVAKAVLAESKVQNQIPISEKPGPQKPVPEPKITSSDPKEAQIKEKQVVVEIKTEKQVVVEIKTEIKSENKVEPLKAVKVAESKFVDIKGYPIHYEKFGKGDQALLMIAGVLGTGKSDFGVQLEGQNALDQSKYTLVSIELPGWGRSRPPKRVYGSNVYNDDVDCCHQLMKKLGYSLYSVLGWGEGAKVALTLAIKYPSSVDKLVVWGACSHVTESDTAKLIANYQPQSWDKARQTLFNDIYGEKTFQVLWKEYLMFLGRHNDSFPNGSLGYSNKLSNIHCPTLVLVGDKDPLVAADHSRTIAKQIPDCQLEIFDAAGHHLHQQFAAKFRDVVEDFLDE